MNYPYENLENFTLRAFLERSVKLYKSRDALCKISHKPMSYAKLHTTVLETAKILQEAVQEILLSETR